MSTILIGTFLKTGLNAARDPDVGAAIPGPAVTKWAGFGLLMLLFATVLAGIWMALIQGVPLPLDAICLQG